MKPKTLITLVAVLVILFVGLERLRAAGPNASPSTGGEARVKGTVKVEGTLPKAKPVNMAADPSCAHGHSGTVLMQEVVADAKGDLQNVIVYVADGLSDRKFDPPTQPAVIEQKGCMYEPHVMALQANQPLQVLNEDQTSHNIHPMPTNNREWNKAELPGSKIEELFPREEVAIPVKCNIHAWMRGYVAVFKHPYFAVTDKTGSFDLSHLPPGTYTIKAWHEKLGTSTQTVNIGANEVKDISFVFKSM